MITKEIKSIGIFCGSALGKNPVYAERAKLLGKLLADEKIHLVYGAGNVGIMGVLADAVLDNGGTVTGVITKNLVDVELAHDRITETIITDTLSERKSIIEGISDAFIALPGGYGTMDEFFEMLTLNQLSIIKKPIGLLNTLGFFNPLIAMSEHYVNEGFVRSEHKNIFVVDENETNLLHKLRTSDLVETAKWLENFKTEKF
jgi:uncharacterized protein (TIGR00730 family)